MGDTLYLQIVVGVEKTRKAFQRFLKKGNIYKLVKLHISISTHRICGELGRTIAFVRLILFLLQLEGWSGFSVFQTSEQEAGTEAWGPTPLHISFPAPHCLLSLSVTTMLQAHLLTHRASLCFLSRCLLCWFCSLLSPLCAKCCPSFEI